MAYNPDGNGITIVKAPQMASSQKVTVTEPMAVASYTWVEGAQPAIAVPGLPPRWAPPDRDPLVYADCGRFILDHNLDKVPYAPMEPALRALLHLSPHYDFSALDVISDRQPLASLLSLAYIKQRRFITRHDYGQDFKFNAQVVGNTVVLTRGDGKVVKDGTAFSGFRKRFDSCVLERPAAVEGAVSHYHLTSYKLGAMEMIVRHSVDAHMASMDQAMPNLDPSTFYETDSGLCVHTAGSLISSSDLVELNTFANTTSVRRAEKQREAWLSRCGHFVIAGYKEVTDPNSRPARNGYAHRRAVFPREETTIASSLTPPNDVMKKYYDLLHSVVGILRTSAGNGEGNLYTVTYHINDVEPLVSPCSNANAAALPTKLCERMEDSTKDGTEQSAKESAKDI